MDQFVSTVSELAAYTMKVNEKAPLLGVQSLMEMLTPGTPNYVFGPNGALGAGFGKLSPEVQAQYTEALNKNFIDPMIQSNAITATTQIGAKLADAGLGFATDTEEKSCGAGILLAQGVPHSKLLPVLYSELLAAALRYRYATPKVYTNGALRIQLTHPTQKAVPCPLFPVPCHLFPVNLLIL